MVVVVVRRETVPEGAWPLGIVLFTLLNQQRQSKEAY